MVQYDTQANIATSVRHRRIASLNLITCWSDVKPAIAGIPDNFEIVGDLREKCHMVTFLVLCMD